MRRARVLTLIALFAVASALAMIAACGGTVYTSADLDGGSDGGAADASADTSAQETKDGTVAASPIDAALDAISDAGIDAHVPTFCEQNASAVWCEDFDEALDASTLGSGVTIQQQHGSVVIVATLPESNPNSMEATILSPDGGLVTFATIAKTLPFSGDAGFTAKADIYFAAPPVGYASNALVVTTGATTASASVLPNGMGGVTVFWDMQFSNSSTQASTSIPVGSYHTLEVVIANGSVSALVDGVQNSQIPLTQAGAQATVQVGLYNSVTSAPEQSTAYFDNVRVTSP